MWQLRNMSNVYSRSFTIQVIVLSTLGKKEFENSVGEEENSGKSISSISRNDFYPIKHRNDPFNYK